MPCTNTQKTVSSSANCVMPNSKIIFSSRFFPDHQIFISNSLPGYLCVHQWYFHVKKPQTVLIIRCTSPKTYSSFVCLFKLDSKHQLQAFTVPHASGMIILLVLLIVKQCFLIVDFYSVSSLGYNKSTLMGSFLQVLCSFQALTFIKSYLYKMKTRS